MDDEKSAGRAGVRVVPAVCWHNHMEASYSRRAARVLRRRLHTGEASALVILAQLLLQREQAQGVVNSRTHPGLAALPL